MSRKEMKGERKRTTATKQNTIRSLWVCLFSFKTHGVQEKFISKLVNSKVNFTRKTDIVLIAS